LVSSDDWRGSPFPQPTDEVPAPPGLDPTVEADDGWGQPLSLSEAAAEADASLTWLGGASEPLIPLSKCRISADWGVLAGPLSDASAVLGRLDARWEDMDDTLRAGVEARVVWRESVAAAVADLPGVRREPLSLWLRMMGLGPTTGEERRTCDEAIQDADSIRVARSFASGLAAAMRSCGPGDLQAHAAQATLSVLGAFRPNVRPLYSLSELITVEPRPDFVPDAWRQWVEAATRHGLPPLAAWAEAAWSWRISMAVSDPHLAEAWVMGTYLLRAQNALRAAPLPMWPGLDRRRQLDAAAKQDPVAHATVLLGGIASSARDHLRLLSALRDRDAVARSWLASRRSGGLATGIWSAVLAQPAVSATRLAEQLDATSQAVTRVLVSMRGAGLVREVSGREAWRIWAAVGV